LKFLVELSNNLTLLETIPQSGGDSSTQINLKIIPVASAKKLLSGMDILMGKGDVSILALSGDFHVCLKLYISGISSSKKGKGVF
jgi:hypothetical protein